VKSVRWRPVAASEHALHPWQQQAAEQQLLADHRVEHDEGDDQRVPTQAPLKNASARSELRKSPKSLNDGPVIRGTIDQTLTRTTNKAAHHQTLLPTRPVFVSSERALRTGGDAGTRGRQQRAGSAASRRWRLLRFDQGDSDAF